jgi:predicted transposase YbfD/YdcC
MRTGSAWCWPKRGVRAGEGDDARAGELTVAPALLAALPLAGRFVTGDALYCQAPLCRQIREQDGHYLVTVKANQPELLWALRTLFTAPPPGEAFASAVTWDQHGDRVERRQLWTSTALDGYLDWPGARQVLRVERRCLHKGSWRREVRYFVTSLGPEVPASALLDYVRGHWRIENRLHWVRDVSLGEDACQVRSGSAPQVLAALRNTVIALVRDAGWTNIAAALRHYAWRPGAALAVLGLSPP